MARDTSDGRLLACVVTAVYDLHPRDDRTDFAIGSLTIAAGVLWDRLADDGRVAWLDQWDEVCGNALRITLPEAVAYHRSRSRRFLSSREDTEWGRHHRARGGDAHP